MKKINIIMTTLVMIWVSPVFADYTGNVTLTDSNWNDIGNEYPAETDTIYVEVYDPDVSSLLEVTFTSDSDTAGELVTLTEVETGLFRGSIPVDFQGFSLLSSSDEEVLLPQRIAQLRSQYSDWEDKRLEIKARSELVREAIERHNNNLGEYHATGVREDGLLQITTGDVITVSYYDMLNDYGNEEEVTDQAVYGGWTGSVSGTWTAANSPYVITGDIYVNGGESLTIEPGVEVRFFGNYGFYVYGNLTAVGTDQDSILFTHHLATGDTTGGDTTGYTGYYWQGLRFYWGDSSYSSQLAYSKIEYAEGGIYVGWSGVNLTIEHSHIQYSKGAGLRFDDLYGIVNVVDCLIEYNNQEWWDNAGIVIYYSYEKERITISNSVVQNNRGSGIHLGWGASGLITGCDFTNNEGYGVTISDGISFDEMSINECNIYDNSSWVDVYVYCCGNAEVEIDMMNNFWGDSTTAEMNEGGNPKNITRIYDWWDENNKPVVNYAGWMQHPVMAEISLSIDELIASPGDTVLVGLYVSIPTDTSFISTEIAVGGYLGQLDFIDVETDSSMIGSAGWSIEYNETDSLLITASAGADGISGEGVLFWLKFAVPDTASGFIPITLELAIFNTGDFPVELTSGGINVLIGFVIDFSGTPIEGPYPLEVSFTDLTVPGSGEIISWLWTFGDGDTSYVQNPAHTYTLPGQYTVSLTVTDSLGFTTNTLAKVDYITVHIIYGDVDLNSTVQAYDAGLILQHLVGLINLNEAQQNIGNVSLDTTLSALDASLILRYVTSLIDTLPYDTSMGSLLASGSFEMGFNTVS
ncbi:MAG: PKD domain-containing protein, partial [Candidatus Marinimicrobia bacterium]|nr:PKD domain-containing protein [Candidatus Neomarinimicrobiota bacterium]